jgi:hypothetical protein
MIPSSGRDGIWISIGFGIGFIVNGLSGVAVANTCEPVPNY